MSDRSQLHKRRKLPSPDLAAFSSLTPSHPEVLCVHESTLLSKYTTLWLKEFLPQSHPFLGHLTHLFTFTVSHPTCPATHTDSTNLSMVIDRVESLGQVDEDGCTVLFFIDGGYDIV